MVLHTVGEPSWEAVCGLWTCVSFLTISPSFSPSAATVYDTVALCRFGAGDECSTREMRLEGIGKYPHVTVELSPGKEGAKASPQSKEAAEGTHEGRSCADSSRVLVVNFGAVAVGSIAEKWIKITNVSPVGRYCTVKHLFLLAIGNFKIRVLQAICHTTYTVEPLYCGHLGDIVKCPV